MDGKYAEYLTWNVEDLINELKYIEEDIAFIEERLNDKNVSGEQKSEFLHDLKDERERVIAINKALGSKGKTDNLSK